MSPFKCVGSFELKYRNFCSSIAYGFFAHINNNAVNASTVSHSVMYIVNICVLFKNTDNFVI